MSRRSQQNFTSVQPDGTIVGVFPGGVQMDAHTGGGSPFGGAIRWVRTADGALVADIRAHDGGDAHQLSHEVWNPDDPIHESALLEQFVEDNVRSYITAFVNNLAGISQGVTLIDSNGKSSFAQLDAAAPIRRSGQICGAISAAGVATVGVGFTVARTGGAPTGDYTVTFDNAMPGQCLPVLTVFLINCKEEIISTTANGFRYQTKTLAAGNALTDAAVSFIAMSIV